MNGKGKIVFCGTQSPQKVAEKMSLDTVYNGNRYRSRLEARFAVFLDTLKIKYEYEPIKAQHLGGNIYYMPDFLIDLPVVLTQTTVNGETLVLAKRRAFVEVKGEMTKADIQKIERFQTVSTDYPLWVVGPTPSDSFFENCTRDMRPVGIDDEFPYYSCGMQGWYDTGMMLCKAPHTKTLGIAHHGMGIRLENIGSSSYTISGSKSWFDVSIQNACAVARMKRFEFQH